MRRLICAYVERTYLVNAPVFGAKIRVSDDLPANNLERLNRLDRVFFSLFVAILGHFDNRQRHIREDICADQFYPSMAFESRRNLFVKRSWIMFTRHRLKYKHDCSCFTKFHCTISKQIPSPYDVRCHIHVLYYLLESPNICQFLDNYGNKALSHIGFSWMNKYEGLLKWHLDSTGTRQGNNVISMWCDVLSTSRWRLGDASTLLRRCYHILCRRGKWRMLTSDFKVMS